MLRHCAVIAKLRTFTSFWQCL